MIDENNVIKQSENEVLPWFIENTSKLIIYNVTNKKINDLKLI
jgi:hypothetical protein